MAFVALDPNAATFAFLSHRFQCLGWFKMNYIDDKEKVSVRRGDRRGLPQHETRATPWPPSAPHLTASPPGFGVHLRDPEEGSAHLHVLTPQGNSGNR